MSLTTQQQRFDALDSCRGICALLVALLHAPIYSHFSGLPLIENAYLFVDFFFVLSGFVIAASYSDRLASGFGVGRFMMLRLGRVYPLYFVMLICFVGFELLQLMVPALGSMGGSSPFLSPQQSPGTVVSSVLLVQIFGQYPFLTWNTPGWSIAAEVWTYLGFALLATSLPGRRVAALTIVCATSLVSLAMLSDRGMNVTYDLGLVRCVAGFAAGALVFDVYNRLRQSTSLWQPSRCMATTLEIASVGGVVAFVVLVAQSNWSILAPLVFAISILVLAGQRGALTKAITAPVFVTLGNLSFSIYMVHLFIGMQLLNLGKLLESCFELPVLKRTLEIQEATVRLGATPFEGDGWTALYVVLVLAASVVTYRLVEVPCRNGMRTLVLLPARQRNPFASPNSA